MCVAELRHRVTQSHRSNPCRDYCARTGDGFTHMGGVY